MTQEPPFHAAQAEAPTIANVKRSRVAAFELLDTSEIIQLSLRPSPLLIPTSSVRIGLLMLALAAACYYVRTSTSVIPDVLCAGAMLTAVARVAIASLEWASRLYILTNRRLICFRGIAAVQVQELPLIRVSSVDIEPGYCMSQWRVGDISIGGGHNDPLHCWECVPNATDVHQLIILAVRRAQHVG